ncbi:unnamed protein product [Phyllotreta striolata]|uniref:Kinetochore protein Nuf2 N-terminal domain-containing protein n=1 Tax=Phyllotreta striolata TaxID=444603 RepID=A0A9N9XSU6_PHYSR|nr:unnamed protein product [Phyllotreta striolata]
MDLVKEIKMYWPDMEIATNNLKTPTTFFIMDLFTRFLKEVKKMDLICCNLNEEVEEIDVIEDEKSIYMKLKTFPIFEMVDINLMLSDIIAPSSKRTKVITKIIVNFLNLYQTCLPDVHASITPALEAIDDYNKICNEREAFEEEIPQLQARKTELINNNAVLVDSIKKLEKKEEEAQIVHNESEEYRKTLKSFEDEVGNIKNSNIALEEEIAHLSSEIVPPEEFTTAKVSLDKLKAEVHNMEAYETGLQQEIKNIIKMHDHAMECTYNIPNEINTMTPKWSLLKEQREELCNQLATLKDDYSAIKSSHDKVIADMLNCEKSLVKLKQNITTTKKIVELKANSLMKLRLESIKTNKENMRKFSIRIEELKQSISKLEDAKGKFLEEFKKEYEEALKEREQFFCSLNLK